MPIHLCLPSRKWPYNRLSGKVKPNCLKLAIRRNASLALVIALREKSAFEQVHRTTGFGASNLPRTPFFQAQLRCATGAGALIR